MKLYVLNLGTVDYEEALKLQGALVRLRHRGKIEDTLVLLEHTPTYTIGEQGSEAMFRTPVEAVLKKGARIYRVDRGGYVTFHGPGQVVGYPIIDFLRRYPNVKIRPNGDVREYREDLERVMKNMLLEFGIAEDSIVTDWGIWYKNGGAEFKLGSVGFRIKYSYPPPIKRVTKHGFAIDVNTDLNWYKLIDPCGYKDKDTISMAELLGHQVDIPIVKKSLLEHFAAVFKYDEIEEITLETIKPLIEQEAVESTAVSLEVLKSGQKKEEAARLTEAAKVF